MDNSKAHRLHRKIRIKMDDLELREPHISGHQNCDQKVKEHDINLKFLITEHTRLAQLGPDEWKLQPAPIPLYTKYNPVDLSLDNLLTLDDFINAPNTLFMGYFFLCRSVTPSIRFHTLMTVVEVPDAVLKNRGTFLSLGNYLHPLAEEDQDCQPNITSGTTIAVKNPVFFWSSTYSIYIVKCDNPADVLILDDQKVNELFSGLKWPSSEIQNEENSIRMRPWWNWWQPVKDWKAVAQLRLQKKNYAGAIEAYALALEYNHKDLQALSLRSGLYFKLEIYRKSLKDAEAILELNGSHQKAICIKSLSLIRLGQYALAIKFVECHIQKCRFIVDSWKKAEFTEILLKAKTWSKQAETGQYDLITMIKCSSTHIQDCADYVGSICPQDIPKKGKGMVATSDIKCGDLLIAAKAFAMTSPDNATSKTNMVPNSQSNQWLDAAYNNLVALIAHRLILDPELGKEIYQLYDGCERSQSKQKSNVDDYNYVDMKRIDAICSYNNFSGATEIIRYENEERPLGVWPLASYLNHSCYDANGNWIICGDFLLIRACRNIKKDEEVTIPYIDCSMPYPERLLVFANYGFRCECTLCRLDAQDSDAIRIRRQEILTSINKLMSEKHQNDSAIEMLIKELRNQRLDDPEHNVYIYKPLFKLAKIYLKRRNYLSAAKIFQSIQCSTIGTMMCEISTKACCYNIVCYMNLDKLTDAWNSFRALQANLIQEYGTDSEEFIKYEMMKYSVMEEDSEDAVVAMEQFGVAF